jgi:hypothetical protein
MKSEQNKDGRKRISFISETKSEVVVVNDLNGVPVVYLKLATERDIENDAKRLEKILQGEE